MHFSVSVLRRLGHERQAAAETNQQTTGGNKGEPATKKRKFEPVS